MESLTTGPVPWWVKSPRQTLEQNLQEVASAISSLDMSNHLQNLRDEITGEIQSSSKAIIEAIEKL